MGMVHALYQHYVGNHQQSRVSRYLT